MRRTNRLEILWGKMLGGCPDPLKTEAKIDLTPLNRTGIPVDRADLFELKRLPVLEPIVDPVDTNPALVDQTVAAGAHVNRSEQELPESADSVKDVSPFETFSTSTGQTVICNVCYNACLSRFEEELVLEPSHDVKPSLVSSNDHGGNNGNGNGKARKPANGDGKSNPSGSLVSSQTSLRRASKEDSRFVKPPTISFGIPIGRDGETQAQEYVSLPVTEVRKIIGEENYHGPEISQKILPIGSNIPQDSGLKDTDVVVVNQRELHDGGYILVAGASLNAIEVLKAMKSWGLWFPKREIRDPPRIANGNNPRRGPIDYGPYWQFLKRSSMSRGWYWVSKTVPNDLRGISYDEEARRLANCGRKHPRTSNVLFFKLLCYVATGKMLYQDCNVRCFGVIGKSSHFYVGHAAFNTRETPDWFDVCLGNGIGYENTGTIHCQLLPKYRP